MPRCNPPKILECESVVAGPVLALGTAVESAADTPTLCHTAELEHAGAVLQVRRADILDERERPGLPRCNIALRHHLGNDPGPATRGA